MRKAGCAKRIDRFGVEGAPIGEEKGEKEPLLPPADPLGGFSDRGADRAERRAAGPHVDRSCMKEGGPAAPPVEGEAVRLPRVSRERKGAERSFHDDPLARVRRRLVEGRPQGERPPGERPLARPKENGARRAPPPADRAAHHDGDALLRENKRRRRRGSGGEEERGKSEKSDAACEGGLSPPRQKEEEDRSRWCPKGERRGGLGPIGRDDSR